MDNSRISLVSFLQTFGIVLVVIGHSSYGALFLLGGILGYILFICLCLCLSQDCYYDMAVKRERCNYLIYPFWESKDLFGRKSKD